MSPPKPLPSWVKSHQKMLVSSLLHRDPNERFTLEEINAWVGDHIDYSGFPKYLMYGELRYL